MGINWKYTEGFVYHIYSSIILLEGKLWQLKMYSVILRAIPQKFQEGCITNESIVEIKQNHKKYWILKKEGINGQKPPNSKVVVLNLITSVGTLGVNGLNTPKYKIKNVRLDFKKQDPIICCL